MQRTLQPLRPTGARAPRAAASAAPRASPRAAARAAPAPGPGPGPGARAAAPAPRGGAAASWQRRSSALAAPSPFPSSPAPSPPASVAELNAGQRAARLAHLEATALAALSEALSHRFRSPVFTCALIAGDVVLLHLLHRLGALAPAGAAGEEPRRGRAAVVFVDTLHLFPETYAFLARCEAAFGFTALRFKPAGFASRGALDAALGPELWRQDEPRYDRVCKVEPFARALAELDADVMVNGRRRDHGFERAQLEPWEGPTPGGGGPTKCQPLAYWEFRDCFDYLAKHGVEAHPLHGQGYPSVGDVHSTVPVPRERWFDYAGERSGRFQGMTGKDGSSPKTECGIHVDGAARAFERDLWVAGGVEALTPDDYAQHGASAGGGAAGGEDVLLVVYAPWRVGGGDDGMIDVAVTARARSP